MLEKIKNRILNYFKTKKLFSIITDFLFVILVILLLTPTTRKPVSAFMIRMVSFPPSSLKTSERFTISPEARQWEFRELSGKTVRFDQLLDKPVFVNFWATWCPPCNAELPGIHDLYEQYKNKVNFVFLSDEAPGTIRTFILKHQYEDMPFYRYNGVPKDFSSNSIPATFIISREGKVVLEKRGAARWDSDRVKTLLNKLLNDASQ
jgi:thiol-disulfide isomerase/thioredoxin